MMVDSAKDHDNNLALARVVMLSNDIADLIGEGSEEILRAFTLTFTLIIFDTFTLVFRAFRELLLF